jgi:hypothetical protein
MKVNEGKKKIFFYDSKWHSPEPTGVLEYWSNGELVKFSHPPVHHSTTPPLHQSIPSTGFPVLPALLF